jgi:hypothetical protein
MKKVIVFALLAVIGVYLTGRVSLGESGAMRFVMEMDSLMNEGKADEVCAMFHDDLEFSIVDHTSTDGGSATVEGGKQDFCNTTRAQVAALQKVPHTMSVDFNDVTVKRSWLHPWTSEISYTEDRTFTIRGANVRLNTTSDDTITLVQTLSGVKLLRVQVEAWIAE